MKVLVAGGSGSATGAGAGGQGDQLARSRRAGVTTIDAPLRVNSSFAAEPLLRLSSMVPIATAGKSSLASTQYVRFEQEGVVKGDISSLGHGVTVRPSPARSKSRLNAI